MIRVRLQRNQDIDPRFRQDQCVLCWGGENVIAAGYGVIENGGLKGIVIRPTCLKSENLTTRILAPGSNIRTLRARLGGEWPNT